LIVWPNPTDCRHNKILRKKVKLRSENSHCRTSVCWCSRHPRLESWFIGFALRTGYSIGVLSTVLLNNLTQSQILYLHLSVLNCYFIGASWHNHTATVRSKFISLDCTQSDPVVAILFRQRQKRYHNFLFPTLHHLHSEMQSLSRLHVVERNRDNGVRLFKA